MWETLCIAAIAVGLIIIMVAAAVGLKDKDGLTLAQMDDMLLNEWQGWVESCTGDFDATFQGKIVGVGEPGVKMLIGVLVEGPEPKGLIEGIKASCEPTYLLEGKILARCVTSPEECRVYSQLTDQTVIDALAPVLQGNQLPDLRLSINAAYVGHMESEADKRIFDEEWEKMQPASGCGYGRSQ